MDGDRWGTISRENRTLCESGTPSGLSHGQLFERFTTQGGEAAERAVAEGCGIADGLMSSAGDV